MAGLGFILFEIFADDVGATSTFILFEIFADDVGYGRASLFC